MPCQEAHSPRCSSRPRRSGSSRGAWSRRRSGDGSWRSWGRWRHARRDKGSPRLPTQAHPLCSPPNAGPTLSALQSARKASTDQLAALRQKFLSAATVDGTGGLQTTGVRWWLKYVVLGRRCLPFTHLTAGSSFEEKLAAENMLLDFALWLVLERPSGRRISARSAAKYVSQVRAWHLRTFRTHLCGDLDYSAMRDTLRGVCRLVQQPAKRQRFGIRTQDLATAMRRRLRGGTAADANWRAALATGFCGLLRAAEFAMQAGETFDAAKHLTRADVTFRRTRAGKEYVILQMRPAKRRTGEGKTVPLMLASGGTLVDPVKELKKLFEADPVPRAEWASTPLFRNEDGSALRVAQVRAVVKVLMGGLGLDPRRFGAHSLRIGGASAGLAGKLEEQTLRAAGRWQSDAADLYIRASKEAMMNIAIVIGSTPFEDLERGVFMDEELMVTSVGLRAARERYGSDEDSS